MKTSNLHPPTSILHPQTSTLKPTISIVITTRNEEKNIENCLQSIRAQSYPNDKIEIIVVDNNSTDKTKEIVRSFSSSLRTCHSEHTCHSATPFSCDSEILGETRREGEAKVKRKGTKSEHIHNYTGNPSVDSYIRTDSLFVDVPVIRRLPHLPRIRLFNRGPERSAQRNFGMIDIAKGKYVMFVDADMILSPCLIESCVKKMEEDCQSSNLNPPASNLKPITVALHIPEVVLGKKYFSKVRRFERSFYNGTVIDGARFFLKEAFVKVGGFDESMSGPEDWDIDKKIKQVGKIGLLDHGGTNYNPLNWELCNFVSQRGVNPLSHGSVIYHNEAEFDLKKYLAKKGYYAKSFDRYIEKWGNNDPDIKKQFGFWYRYFVVFLEDGKWKRLITHPILVFGMYYLRFMIGIKFLTGRNRI